MQVLLGASSRLALGDLGCKSEARIHVPLLWISFTIELHLAPGLGVGIGIGVGRRRCRGRDPHYPRGIISWIGWGGDPKPNGSVSHIGRHLIADPHPPGV